MNNGQPECESCNDELWVCEFHEHEAMDHKLPDGTLCGAGGMPCPVCNEGLERGSGRFEFKTVDRVASDSPLDVTGIPKIH